MECFSYKGTYVGVVDVNVCISSHLKEELAWAADKWLWVISTNSYCARSCLLMILTTTAI